VNEPYYVQDKPEECVDPVKLAALKYTEALSLPEMVALARDGVAVIAARRKPAPVDTITSDNP